MLDEYSQNIKERLAALKPEWKSFFSEYMYKDQPYSYVLLTIPSPSQDKFPLIFYSADEEITVTFGMWEWHYPNPSDPESDELVTAIEEMSKFQNDENLVVSYWNGEKWVGSTVVKRDEPIEMPEFAQGAKSAKVLSWSGRFNREFVL